MKHSAASIQKLRKEYAGKPLRESMVPAEPSLLFEMWFSEAIAARIVEPNAMCLATATKRGIPSARMVLMKNFSASGLSFATSYKSRKASEISTNGRGALVFYWAELERQVRVEGKIVKSPKSVSDSYFATRPHGSQLGAIVAPQSSIVTDQKAFLRRYTELKAIYRKGKIPRPAFWGGYLLKPYSFEFWQGRPNRLHDRLYYSRLTSGRWKMVRLAP